MENSDVIRMFNDLLDELANQKSDKRSDRDRYVAITMTEVEKAFAVYLTYCGEQVSPMVNWNK